MKISIKIPLYDLKRFRLKDSDQRVYEPIIINFKKSCLIFKFNDFDQDSDLGSSRIQIIKDSVDRNLTSSNFLNIVKLNEIFKGFRLKDSD